MTRWWNQLVAVLADGTPGGVVCLALSLLLIAAGVAVLWYTWPPRLPFLRRRGTGGVREKGGRRFRWPRWAWLKWRWRFAWSWLRHRRRGRPAAAPDVAELGPDELPDLPAEVLALTADELAEAGRYAEAVRERLRAIVRELIERQVIEHRPGWTVMELAYAAGRSRPEAAEPLRGAGGIFSEIWYGQRPATVDDDARMREHAAEVHRAVLTEAVR